MMSENTRTNGSEFNLSGTLSPKAFYEDADGIKETDIRALAFENGEIVLTGTIDSNVQQHFNMMLRMLASKGQKAKVYINSPGGEIVPGLAMLDAIQYYPHDIDICCCGIAASMAAVLLAGGRKGHRYIMPNSKVMIHEPLVLGQFGGSASSVEKTAKNILETKDRMNKLLAELTGNTIGDVEKAASFDHYYTAEEAVEFGLCDEISSGYIN